MRIAEYDAETIRAVLENPELAARVAPHLYWALAARFANHPVLGNMIVLTSNDTGAPALDPEEVWVA